MCTTIIRFYKTIKSLEKFEIPAWNLTTASSGQRMATDS